jgi:Zn-dependent protease
MNLEPKNEPRQKHLWQIARIANVPIETDSGSLGLTVLLFLFIQSAISYSYPEWSLWLSLSLSFLITLSLYGSILAHELGHCLTAIRYGVEVRRISLSPLGGISHIPIEPDSPDKEMLIAVAGPVVSFGIGGIFGLAWLVVPTSGVWQPLSFLLLSFAAINFMLAVFNLLPGLPLDGGRVLRGLIWAKTGDYDRATLLVGYFGVALGAIMMLISLGLFSTGYYYVGFTLCFTGIFVMVSALLGTRYSRWQGRLRAVAVGGIFRQDFGTADANLSLGQLLSQHLLQRPFIVLVDQGRLVGTVSLTDSKKVISSRWWDTPATAVMTPIHQTIQVYPTTNALQASHLMQQHKTSLALVMAHPDTTDLTALLGVVAQHHLHAVARRK